MSHRTYPAGQICSPCNQWYEDDGWFFLDTFEDRYDLWIRKVYESKVIIIRWMEHERSSLQERLRIGIDSVPLGEHEKVFKEAIARARVHIHEDPSISPRCPV